MAVVYWVYRMGPGGQRGGLENHTLPVMQNHPTRGGRKVKGAQSNLFSPISFYRCSVNFENAGCCLLANTARWSD